MVHGRWFSAEWLKHSIPVWFLLQAATSKHKLQLHLGNCFFGVLRNITEFLNFQISSTIKNTLTCPNNTNKHMIVHHKMYGNAAIRAHPGHTQGPHVGPTVMYNLALRRPPPAFPGTSKF